MLGYHIFNSKKRGLCILFSHRDDDTTVYYHESEYPAIFSTYLKIYNCHFSNDLTVLFTLNLSFIVLNLGIYSIIFSLH